MPRSRKVPDPSRDVEHFRVAGPTFPDPGKVGSNFPDPGFSGPKNPDPGFSGPDFPDPDFPDPENWVGSRKGPPF